MIRVLLPIRQSEFQALMDTLNATTGRPHAAHCSLNARRQSQRLRQQLPVLFAVPTVAKAGLNGLTSPSADSAVD
jgi:hypothetical protein